MKRLRKPRVVKSRSDALPGFKSERRGFVVPGTVTATEAKNEFGQVFEEAIDHGAIVITRHESPRAVLIAYDEYEALVGTNAQKLDGLRAEFDAQFERMQAPDFNSRMEAAFAASPKEMGRAAVAAARRRG